jgi:hypothetical protein
MTRRKPRGLLRDSWARLAEREQSAIQARVAGAGRVVFEEKARNAVALCVARQAAAGTTPSASPR